MRRGIGILLPTTLLLLVVGPLPAQAGGFGSTSTAVSSAAVRADFNGDSRADLAIGAPRENDASGVVHVLYGSSTGLTASGSQLWSQDSPGIAGVAEPFDQFGWALATGDFNGDGRTDLAVGAYSENDFAGVVQVLYGSPTGLTAAGSQLWSQDSPGIAGTAEVGDEFGVALAAGDFNGDSRADLGIGAPGENDRGVVQVLYGSPSGLTGTGSQLWSQGSSGLGGLAESGDSFGSALAAGDFNGDGRADLAASALGENNFRGVVQVLYGSASGLIAAGNQLWSQDSPGIAGLAEPDDQFGFAVATGDFNGDNRADLAIGVRGENDFAGVAQVLYGSPSGLTAAGSQLWSQDSPGIADVAEPLGDEFGYRLAAGDFNGDSRADLAVSAAGENDFAGVVHVLYGSASGLTAAGSQLWSQDSPGITGTAEVGDSFGFAVAAGDFNGDSRADLAIGAPGENDLAGVVHVLYGTASGLTASGSQLWSQDSPGIAGVAESTDFFGGALAAGSPSSNGVGTNTASPAGSSSAGPSPTARARRP
jgi:disulfide bond formation protein DsbB